MSATEPREKIMVITLCGLTASIQDGNEVCSEHGTRACLRSFWSEEHLAEASRRDLRFWRKQVWMRRRCV